MRYIIHEDDLNDLYDLDDLYGALRTKFHHTNTIKRELDVMCA